MYKVLVVEDEKASSNFLCSILKKEYPGFEVLEPAENGLAGWNSLEQNKPDLVITDIRMPVMTGLELVSKIHESFPGINCLILSGYQDFEYAREAMASGVADYLLKPITPSKLREAIDRLMPSLQRIRLRTEQERLRACIAGSADKYETGEDGESDRSSTCRMAVFRYGSLVSRFSPFSRRDIEGFHDPLWVFGGRDGREFILLASAADLTGEEFSAAVEGARERLGEGSVSMFIQKSGCLLSDLRSLYSEALILIDRNLVLGKTLTINSDYKDSSQPIEWDKELEYAVDYALVNREIGRLQKYLFDNLQEWIDRDLPAIRIETALKELFYIIRKMNPSPDHDDAMKPEILLELYLSEYKDPETLKHQLSALIKGMLSLDDRDTSKDIPDSFNAVLLYVDRHFKDNLKLSELSEIFHLSKSYLSRQFSKYTGASFSDYLRKCRINAAMDLIRLNQNMPLQDVAQYCGFDDPFYFSKVFKAESGMTPTQFRKSLD